ncbi:MAG: pyrroline-5-carboxylate reductase [Limnobacter sp.]|nr:pyrroline-5-carboxylate reductase [Limnobacter sp.]
MRKTVFIGGGNMAFAILGGLLEAGNPVNLFHVIEINPDAQSKITSLGISCSAEFPQGFEAEQVLLAVKPQSMQTVLEAQASNLKGVLLISIAAGVSIAKLREWSGQADARVARTMPNTPALVGQGMTGVYCTSNCSADDKGSVLSLFKACGETVEVPDEAAINAITAISGSGPGYVFFMMEALQKAAQNLGFTEGQARTLVAQTFLGSAELATQSPDSFATLREKVTSKGGTTFAGLEQYRAGGVDEAIIKAAQAAMARALELQG